MLNAIELFAGAGGLGMGVSLAGFKTSTVIEFRSGVTVRFHKEGWTFSAGKMDATQTLLFQVLGSVSQFERAIIRERQAEGIAKAKAAGKYKGRKAKLSKGQMDEIRRRCGDGEEKKALAAEFDISRQTLYRIIKE